MVCIPKNKIANNPSGDDWNEDTLDDTYRCNICFEQVTDPVVSFCGHLFCWPCLHQWISMRPRGQVCPMCKALITRNMVVPLYGRGTDYTQDPRNKIIAKPRHSPTRKIRSALSSTRSFIHRYVRSVILGNTPMQNREPEDRNAQMISRASLVVGILFLLWLVV